MSFRLEFDESQRQILVLAMGRLAAERPGWRIVLREIADKIHRVGGSAISGTTDSAGLMEYFETLAHNELFEHDPKAADPKQKVEVRSIRMPGGRWG